MAEAHPRVQALSHGHARRARYATPSMDAKIVVMGNTGTGKTSLLQRYTQNRFEPRGTAASTGAFFVTKKVDVQGVKVRLQLWDTAGQERFRSMAPMYYRGAHAALLLYDITSLPSFQACKGWLEELKRNCGPELLIYLVGAKADLLPQRQVSPDLVRVSLRNWFPPPRPAAPAQPASNASTFGYIRPRFTSLSSLASLRSVGSGDDPTPEPAAAAAATPVRAHARADSGGALLRTATGTPVRTRTTSAAPLGRSQSVAAATVMSPSRFGALAGPSTQGWASLADVDAPPSPPDPPDDAGGEWGLAGVELFEASAKDGRGIDTLFDGLIGALLARREAIEAENALRKRDSVALAPATPAWAVEADRDAAAEKSHSSGGWSCCSV